MNYLLAYQTELCLLCSRPFIPESTTMDGLCGMCQGELIARCAPVSLLQEECEIPVHAATIYDGPIVPLLETVKRRGHRRPLRFIARALLPAALHQTQGPLYPIPASRRGRRERGFDQMRLIAHHTDRRYHGVFTRHRGRQQKQLNRELRQRNAQETLGLHSRGHVGLPPGVILDDVLTTGATVSRAISLLREAGVMPRAVVVIAAAL